MLELRKCARCGLPVEREDAVWCRACTNAWSRERRAPQVAARKAERDRLNAKKKAARVAELERAAAERVALRVAEQGQKRVAKEADKAKAIALKERSVKRAQRKQRAANLEWASSHDREAPRVEAAVHEDQGIGIWRVGPVIYDWSGLSGVGRCEQCPETFGPVLFRGTAPYWARAHAAFHGFHEGRRVPVPQVAA